MKNENTSHFVGIDIGTSGVRAVCIDSSMRVHSSASTSFSCIESPRSNPRSWLTAIQIVISDILESTSPKTVKAIAVDGTSGTTIGTDGKGNPVTMAKMYNEICHNNSTLEQIEKYAPATSAAHGATSGLAKAIELSNAESVAFIQHEADWIAYALSGVPGLSDENNSLKTGYDPTRQEWPAWIDNTAMDRAKLAKVLRAGEPIGEARGQLSITLGLSDQTLIVAGTTDGCASFLATGAEEVGDGVTVLGTTLTIKLLSAEPIFAPEYGIYSHKIGGIWLAGGASNTGGRVLEHFYSKDQLARLSSKININKIVDTQFYPLLEVGERFPINDSSLQPLMSPRPESDVSFLHALLDGIGNIEKLAYQRLMELGGPPLNSIRTAGGGAINDTWTQLRKNKLAVPFQECFSDQAAMGAAILAKRGALEAGIVSA